MLLATYVRIKMHDIIQHYRIDFVSFALQKKES